MVYPPAIVVFIMTLVYAVMSPLILVFGAIYFANACKLRLRQSSGRSSDGNRRSL
jgi:hypothetical protein